jgi:hypothetical protein
VKRALQVGAVSVELCGLLIALVVGLPSLFQRAYPNEAYLLASIIAVLWVLAAVAAFISIRARRFSFLGLFALCGYLALLMTGWFDA